MRILKFRNQQNQRRGYIALEVDNDRGVVFAAVSRYNEKHEDPKETPFDAQEGISTAADRLNQTIADYTFGRQAVGVPRTTITTDEQGNQTVSIPQQAVVRTETELKEFLRLNHVYAKDRNRAQFTVNYLRNPRPRPGFFARLFNWFN